MNRRDLTLFFLLEVGAIIWAASVFSILSNKLLAGALAGLYFVLSGLFMLMRARRWAHMGASLTFYLLLIHVFVISLPLQLGRFAQFERAFEDVRVLGFTGPQFHQASTLVFSCLIAATVIDWLRAWRSERSSA